MTEPQLLCGATAVFWPDDEACDATCIRPWQHPGIVHEDEILGEWDEDDLPTSVPAEPLIRPTE
ncbi:MAG TPA: hypothetical protein VIS06_11225 [Mycobacteriales bacterium]